MRRMVGVEGEIPPSVDEFPIDFGGQCRVFSDDQKIKKGNRTICFHGELDGRPKMSMKTQFGHFSYLDPPHQ
jgi:hypothetical protein